MAARVRYVFGILCHSRFGPGALSIDRPPAKSMACSPCARPKFHHNHLYESPQYFFAVRTDGLNPCRKGRDREDPSFHSGCLCDDRRRVRPPLRPAPTSPRRFPNSFPASPIHSSQPESLQIGIGMAALWPRTRALQRAGLLPRSASPICPLHLWDDARPDPVFPPPTAATIRGCGAGCPFIWAGYSLWKRASAKPARAAPSRSATLPRRALCSTCEPQFQVCVFANARRPVLQPPSTGIRRVPAKLCMWEGARQDHSS